ncbi:Glycosyl phosphatidyl inositol protein transamidase complex subunit [Dimargaris verticillata]|uniref:Glycosyl phosphatidyl inositol protein transamidase complex subunit n=1 Tax=Dimargaris verticillata TaxID=2761393 RepID=A0A9W8B4Z9_9FUNG|nr:Glycosyl phosphatidyl inositol protein transamidase complex subunit [Dimargaris verticillata]
MTDDKRVRQGVRTLRVVTALRRHINWLSWGLLAVGLAWLLVLPLELYSNRTYLSENALMPNQARRSYGDAQVAAAHQHLQALVNRHDQDSRVAYVFEWLQRLGYHAETQSFQYTQTFVNQTWAGTNVHGVLHAPRADTTEALMLVAPWRFATDPNRSNLSGVAHVLALAQYFRELNHWAKDLILLFPGGPPTLGIEMWLRRYHGEAMLSPHQADPLYVRSGVIQGALTFELPHTAAYASLGIFHEGKNGQLPNLDLLNIIARITKQENVPLTLHHIVRSSPAQLNGHQRNWLSSDNWPLLYRHYLDSLRTLWTTMAAQATGLTQGTHAPFHRYRIDAVTLQAAPHPEATGPAAPWPNGPMAGFHFQELGRVTESVFRSLNNLLEHFHQSFFIYLLPSPWQYISIANFIPPVLLMAAGLLGAALGSWWSVHGYYQPPSSMARSNPPLTTTTKQAAYDWWVQQLFAQTETQFPRRIHNYAAFWTLARPTLAVLVVFHLGLGTLLYLLPTIVPQSLQIVPPGLFAHLGLSTAEAHMALTQGFTLFSCLVSFGAVRQWYRNCYDPRLLRMLTLLLLMLAIAAVSVVNFSLALALAMLTAVPFSLLPTPNVKFEHPTNDAPAVPTFSGGPFVWRSVLLAWVMAISPPVLANTMAWATNQTWTQLWSGMVVEHQLFGSWVYPLLCFIYWPALMSAVLILCYPSLRIDSIPNALGMDK